MLKHLFKQIINQLSSVVLYFYSPLMSHSSQPDPISHPQQQPASPQKSPSQSDLQLYPFQVSGKSPKYANNAEGIIYKQYTEKQYLFFEFLQKIEKGDQRYELREFIPKYYGMVVDESIGSPQKKVVQHQKEEKKVVEKQKEKQGSNREIWMQHICSRNRTKEQNLHKFILLKNMTFGYVFPNIIDLKLGVKKAKKSNVKYENSTTDGYHFRINGMMVGLKQGGTYQEYFLSKYQGQKITVQQTEAYLLLFFFNGKQIHLELLKNVIDQLDKLIVAFKKFKGVKLFSSSLFIAYDAQNPNNYNVNLIDFDHYQHGQNVEDQNTGFGLQNAHKFLVSAQANYELHLSKLRKRELDVFKKERVIPKQKVDKYKP